MKSIKQLEQLAKNPHYTMTDEELQALNNSTSKVESVVTSVEHEAESKKKLVTKGYAPVKETGKVTKHKQTPTKE